MPMPYVSDKDNTKTLSLRTTAISLSDVLEYVAPARKTKVMGALGPTTAALWGGGTPFSHRWPWFHPFPVVLLAACLPLPGRLCARWAPRRGARRAWASCWMPA